MIIFYILPLLLTLYIQLNIYWSWETSCIICITPQDGY